MGIIIIFLLFLIVMKKFYLNELEDINIVYIIYINSCFKIMIKRIEDKKAKEKLYYYY